MKPLLAKLATAPASQADPVVTEACARMARDGYTADEVKALLDQIAHAALASEFFIVALDIVYRAALAGEEQAG